MHAQRADWVNGQVFVEVERKAIGVEWEYGVDIEFLIRYLQIWPYKLETYLQIDLSEF